MRTSFFLRACLTTLFVVGCLCACNLRTTNQTSAGTQTGIPAEPATPEQTAATETDQPGTTEDGNMMRSTGADQPIRPAECFDLDAGAALPLENEDCDFAIQSTGEESSLDFIPLSYASFAFSSVFWEKPASEACSTAGGHTNLPQWISTAQSYYVCYQTGEGYWGYLFLRAFTSPILTIDWVTFDQQDVLLVEQPVSYPSQTQTPALERFIAEGVNQWVGYGSGLDMDNFGQAVQADGVDLAVVPGIYDPAGVLLDVALQPQHGAVFDFSLPLSEPPTNEACLEASYSTTTAQVVSPHRYFCYRTERKRLGYLYIHEVNPGVGVRLDWFTWVGSVPDVLVANEPATTSEIVHRAELLAANEPVPVFAPGRKFTQTWQLVNTGETTWSSLFALVFSAGNQMEGVARQNIRFTVEPGDDVKISLNLTAPPDFGTYIGEYWLEDTQGNRFGLGSDGAQPLQVLVNVGEPGLTLAEGSRVALIAGACFDLDLGYIAVDDPACDIHLNNSLDVQMAQFSAPQAAFGFNELITQTPRLGQCRQARLSSGNWMLDVQNWYVCYKTDQGRYGWLYIHEVDAGQLLFDWKTYQ